MLNTSHRFKNFAANYCFTQRENKEKEIVSCGPLRHGGSYICREVHIWLRRSFNIDQLTEWTIEEKSVCLPSKSWSCFCSMFMVVIHPCCEVSSCHFCSIWPNVSGEYRSVELRVPFSTSISSNIRWLSLDTHSTDSSPSANVSHPFILIQVFPVQRI